MGRSRGGLTTKIHALIDGRGGPRGLHLQPGHAADCAEAAALLGRLGSGMRLVGDKAYDTNEILGFVAEAGRINVIPSRSYRKEPRSIDSAAYATRSLIERFFGRIKEFRRVATRYDKRARNFLAAVMLAATQYLLREFARNEIASTA